MLHIKMPKIFEKLFPRQKQNTRILLLSRSFTLIRLNPNSNRVSVIEKTLFAELFVVRNTPLATHTTDEYNGVTFGYTFKLRLRLSRTRSGN